jgi:SiaC family regulatory phosphoprotein
MTGFTNLIIEQTPKTPHIDLNKFTGDLIFSGRSTPEDAAKIFGPVIEWAEEYIKSPKPVTNVRLNLDVFNTTTALWLSKVLRVLAGINEPDHVLMLHLYLQAEEYDSVKDFNDIRDIFISIADILHDETLNLCIRLYGKDENGGIIRQKLILIEAGLCIGVEA